MDHLAGVVKPLPENTSWPRQGSSQLELLPTAGRGRQSALDMTSATPEGGGPWSGGGRSSSWAIRSSHVRPARRSAIEGGLRWRRVDRSNLELSMSSSTRFALDCCQAGRQVGVGPGRCAVAGRAIWRDVSTRSRSNSITVCVKRGSADVTGQIRNVSPGRKKGEGGAPPLTHTVVGLRCPRVTPTAPMRPPRSVRRPATLRNPVPE